MVASFLVAVIDDDDEVRHTTAELVRNAGHRVKCFTAGAEFLASDLPEDLDCILLDMVMPGMDGLAVMRALRERGDKFPILVLSGHGDIRMAVAAMRLGAVDFLEKPYPPKDLIDAIARSAMGMAGGAKAGPPANGHALRKVATLSRRERNLLIEILRGKRNRLIAVEAGLSVRTVETYRSNMMTKLGVRSTADAIKVAIAAGLGDA